MGNEIHERADSEGLEIASQSKDLIKTLDPSRPVTQAICRFWDHPGREWDDLNNAFELLDIAAYNYQWERYEKDHKAFPRRIFVGTESVATEALENWNMVEKHPYIIGDFIWTGMDYIGESGIGHSIYLDKPPKQSTFLMPWPWYNSWCGDLDIIGNKKPQSYYRDVVWNNSLLEIMVHEPIPERKKEYVHFLELAFGMAKLVFPGNQDPLIFVPELKVL